jgi:hypothetical protein
MMIHTYAFKVILLTRKLPSGKPELALIEVPNKIKNVKKYAYLRAAFRRV